VKAGTGTLILNDGATRAKAPLPRRTWLGVATDEVSPELHAQLPLAEGAGLLIRSVTDGSPAAQADLRINDILVKFDDQLVVNSEQLGALVRMKKEGDSVHLTYLRGGHEAIAEVKLGANEYTGTTTINNTLTLADPATITLTGATDGKIYVGQPIVQSQASFSDAVKQLDKVMHDAGVSEEVVAKTRQAITEAVAQMQKAVSDAGAPKDEIERNARKALEEVRRAIEKAWRAEEGEASKADPR